MPGTIVTGPCFLPPQCHAVERTLATFDAGLVVSSGLIAHLQAAHAQEISRLPCKLLEAVQCATTHFVAHHACEISWSFVYDSEFTVGKNWKLEKAAAGSVNDIVKDLRHQLRWQWDAGGRDPTDDLDRLWRAISAYVKQHAGAELCRCARSWKRLAERSVEGRDSLPSMEM